MEIHSAKTIEDEILNNYLEYQYLFIEFQSKFLSDLYANFQNVENGNIVLYFAKNTHQGILRQKDYDLNFNISYEKFWENHSIINPKRNSLAKIAENTFLPKETVRRKILQLIKQRVLNKKNRIIGWLPNEQYKKNYQLITDMEIDNVGKLISYICEKINLSISREEIAREIKEKFSFYWFHYLGTQLEYLRLWSKQFNDLELVLIFIQAGHLFTSKVKNISHKDLYDNPSLIKKFVSASINATSIADITGIPRATCLRKLEKLVKLKMLSQDKFSKRYYIIPDSISENLVSQKVNKKVVKIFSKFFFTFTKTVISKI